MSEYGKPEYIGGGVYVLPYPSGMNILANHHENPSDRVWVDNDILDEIIKLRNRMAEEARKKAEAEE